VTKFVGDGNALLVAVPADGHVANDEVDGGHHQAEQGQGSADFEEVPESEFVSVLKKNGCFCKKSNLQKGFEGFLQQLTYIT
jgi:hypothetical protein